MMNGCRASDSLVVSGKPSNKIRDNKRIAEEVEKRRLAKGNRVRQNKDRTLSRATLQSELNRIRQVATVRHYLRQEPGAVIPHAGSVRGVPGNRHSYRDHFSKDRK